MKKIIVVVFALFTTSIFAQENGEEKKLDNFKINLRAGIHNSFFEIEKDPSLFNVNIQNQISPRLGVEFEYILPFDERKWSALSEVFYHGYNYDGTVVYFSDNSGEKFDNVDVNYTSFNLSLGIKYTYAEYGRFKSYLAPKAIYAFATSNSMVDFETFEDYDIESTFAYSLALGFIYDKKYYFEFEYSAKNMVETEVAKAKLNTLTFLFAYAL